MNREISRFQYRTTINGATYRVLLTARAIRLDLVLPAPYVVSCSSERVQSTGIDYPTLLAQTAAALRPVYPHDFAWRICTIASDRGGFISAYADLTLDDLSASAARCVRDALPQGIQTRASVHYRSRPITRQESSTS